MILQSKHLVLAILLCGACGDPQPEPPPPTPTTTTPINPKPTNNNNNTAFDRACTVVGVCINYQGAGFDEPTVERACSAAMGAVSADCPTQNAVGSCAVTTTTGSANLDVVYWYYAPLTVAQAQTQCTALTGAFTAR